MKYEKLLDRGVGFRHSVTRSVFLCCLYGIIIVSAFSLGLLVLNNGGILEVLQPSCLLPFETFIEMKNRLTALRDLARGSEPLPQTVLVLIYATGGYFKMALGLVDSAQRHFCSDCSNVTYAIFTDAEESAVITVANSTRSNQYIQFIKQRRLGWPGDTLKRYHSYLAQYSLIEVRSYFCHLANN